MLSNHFCIQATGGGGRRIRLQIAHHTALLCFFAFLWIPRLTYSIGNNCESCNRGNQLHGVSGIFPWNNNEKQGNFLSPACRNKAERKIKTSVIWKLKDELIKMRRLFVSGTSRKPVPWWRSPSAMAKSPAASTPCRFSPYPNSAPRNPLKRHLQSLADDPDGEAPSDK